MVDILDFSGKVPRIRGHRVTVFDVMLLLETSSDPRKKMSRMWNLSEEEITEILEYINSNKDYLEELQSYFTERLEEEQDDQTVYVDV